VSAVEERPRRTAEIACFALALVPLAFLVASLARSALDVPLWDAWELVPLLDRSYDGTLTLRDLWVQHNEHRIFFPKLWMIALARASGGSVSWDVASNVSVAALWLFFLARNAKKLFENEGSRRSAVAFPVLSLLVFSMAQWENWICGWQIQIWLAVVSFTLAAFLLLAAPLKPARVAGAGLFAVVGTFSFADGVLAWPLLAAVLFLAFPSRETRRTALLWIAAGALVVGLYLVGYHATQDHPSPLAALEHPLRFADYVLRFLGTPLGGRDRWAARFLGGGGLLVAGVAARELVRRGVPLARLAPWFALALYALGCALLAGLGRAGPGEGYGPHQAMSSRYVTLAMPLWIACGVLLLLLDGVARKEALPSKVARLLPRVVLGLLVALAAVNSVRQSSELRETVGSLGPARDAIVLGDVASVPSEAIAPLLPRDRADVALLRQRVAVLRRRGLGPFGTR
jgi:hypothetical protein